MGNQQCGAEGRPCAYYVNSNATPGTLQDKENRLLNYLVGITSSQQLMSEIQGDGFTPAWNLAYILIFSPVMPVVYSLNSNMKHGSGQVGAYSYSTGSASAIASSTLIGNGTSWNSGMVGGIFVSGLTNVIITSYSSPTNLTVSTPITISSTVPYTIYYTDTSQCSVIPNPYYEAALVLADVMAGAGQYTNFNMPCSKGYSVPFALYNMGHSGTGNLGTVIFHSIPNNPTASGGGFNSCWPVMVKNLETAQNLGGQELCIGDSGLPTTGQNSTTYSSSYIKGVNFLQWPGIKTNPPPFLTQFLTNPFQNYKSMFPPNTPYGPYDTSTYQPCVHVTDPECTNTLCHGTQPVGYNCQAGGKCNPIYASVPPPQFATLEECTGCQQTGNCGQNTCCPESQTGGACPTNPTPPTPPSYTRDILIGIAVLCFIILLVVLGVRYGNRLLFSSEKFCGMNRAS